MMLVNKTVCNKLAEKVNKIDTSGFALKTRYETDKSELEKKSLMQLILLKQKNSLN